MSFLTGGARDAPGRHQTLRAAIDWSYELLGREERSVFVKLSVFAGGCTADAAAVCEATEDDLQDLVDKSLLVHSEGRYTMLETIREFARDLLQASGEADAACAAHADWYFTLAREFQAEAPNAVQLDEATWASWRPRLDAELDNLRTAFDWLVGCGRREEGFELALALLVFWARGGHFQAEEVRWLKKGFVATGPITEATRGDALHFLGLSQFLGGGTPAECESPLLEALEIRRALAEPERIAATLRALSFVALEQGAFERARALWAELVALELGDPKWTYMENELLGEIELAAGNLDEALEYNERALAEARDLDLIRMVPDLLHVVGDVHLLRRSLDEAEGHYREGLALAWRSGFDRPVYECLGGLAAVAFWSGAMRRAGRLWGVVERASFLRPSFHERYERTLANCTDPPFLEGLADAERLSLEEATAYALSVEHDSWS